jgi:amino acid adenylation domain-containing protein
MQQPVSAGFPLSIQQRNLWNWQAEKPGFAELRVTIEGALDVAKLKDALANVVARHEILRTTFQRSSGMKYPFQVVSSNPLVEWQSSDLLSATCDLQNGPVVRASLTPTGQGKHVLAVRLPAMSADAASLTNILAELTSWHAGSPIDNEALQYADYSEWQSQLLQSEDTEAQTARQYWSRQDLSSLLSPAIPFERRSPGNAEFSPAQVAVPIDAATLARLREFDNPESALLAAWQLLMWRISGQAEFKIGYLSSGRDHDELRGAVGLFTRTIPLSTSIEQPGNFKSLVSTAERAIAEAVANQDYYAGDHDHDVSFRFEQWPRKISAGPVSFSVGELVSETERFKVELRSRTDDSNCSVSIAYDPDRFSRHAMELLAKRYAILLAAAASHADSGISELPIMDEAERQQVTAEFNRTTADFPREKCIQQLFEEQAARTPNRPALRFGEKAFTYSELNARANQIAHALRERGVGPNVPVGLCIERSAEMIVGLLGILKAGGCYVPLVPDNPKARLEHQLKETAAPVVITEEKLVPRLPEWAYLCLDRDAHLLDQQPTSNPKLLNSSQHTVYVIYTSGSTGVPKGVAVRHSNLVNYSSFICRRLNTQGAADGLNFATVSTLSADLGNTCIFPSLISGGCLHVIGYEMAMAANLFADYSKKYPIDVLKITPSHLASLLNTADAASLLPRKYLVLGGEASTWDLIARIRQLGNCDIINHYGPTEATVGCCTFAVSENDVSEWSPATVPIGRPIANDEIYILDQQFRPVPLGVAGELCIGGAGLAKGYLNQPQQTAERFISHPFSSDENARVYRTGDLARFLPDGNIEFLGRLDHQVKIRGFRVEPAEIQAALERHPAVIQTVIIPYSDSGEKRLAAYLVLKTSVAADELRNFLLNALPEYMVPTALVVLDSLPLTPNGKIDTRALPSPDQAQARPGREFLAPRNAEEEKLVAIWMEVLKLGEVSVNDNFFDLGGHSLLATQIISRVRNTFRVQMPLHSFLETPTIAGLAEKIPQCPAAESEEEEMTRLLQELEGISDEEAERLLHAADADGGSGGESGK